MSQPRQDTPKHKRLTPGQPVPPLSGRISADARVAERISAPDGVPHPTFGSDIWDLRELLKGKPKSKFMVLNFTRIAQPSIRLACKEYVFLRMRHKKGSHKAWKPLTAVGWLGRAVLFANFLEQRGVSRLSEVTSAHLDDYLAAVLAQDVTPETRRYRVNVPKELHEWQDRLSEDGFGFEPYGGRKRVVRVDSSTYRENLTPRIPETVMGPYLKWCLRYVTEFAPEILEAVADLREMRRLEGNHPDGKSVGREQHLTRLQRYLERLRREGRGVPDHGTVNASYVGTRRREALSGEDPLARVNLRRICVEALGTTDTKWLQKNLQALGPLVSEVGLASDVIRQSRAESLVGLRGSTISASSNDINVEIINLQTACYVIIGFLSGMRDSELKSLMRGCVQEEKGRDGKALRYRLNGRVFKHRGEDGDAEQWVVIEPVVDAIHALEALHEALGCDSTVPLLATVSLMQIEGAETAGGHQCVRMNQLRDRCNTIAKHSKKTPRIPDHEGNSWHFTTSQLRRTLAWYIVNEPFGVIAGALQFKHADARIMEGYGGREAAGFRAEKEREALRRTMNLARDLYDDRADGRASGVGGGAKQVDAQLDAIRADFAGQVVDEARLLRRLKSVAVQLHTGILNDCFYDEAKAACKPYQSRPGVPAFVRCLPGKCPNSRIGPEHRPVWQMAHDRAAELLTHRRKLPMLQVQVIEENLDEYRRVLEMLDRIIDEEMTDGAQ